MISPEEVIFVGDNSADGTAGVAKELARHDARVRCIRRVGRSGLSVTARTPWLEADIGQDRNQLKVFPKFGNGDQSCQ